MIKEQGFPIKLFFLITGLLVTSNCFAVDRPPVRPIALASWKTQVSDPQAKIEITSEDQRTLKIKYDLGPMNYLSDRKTAFVMAWNEPLDIPVTTEDAIAFQIMGQGKNNFIRIELEDFHGFKRKRELTHIRSDGQFHTMVISIDDFEFWGGDHGENDLSLLRSIYFVIYNGWEEEKGTYTIRDLRLIRKPQEPASIHIGINQLGFSPESSKKAIIRLENFSRNRLRKSRFKITNLSHLDSVFEDNLQRLPFRDWPGIYYEADFTELVEPGLYQLEAQFRDREGRIYSQKSEPFSIENQIYLKEPAQMAMEFLNALKANQPEIDGFPEMGGFHDTDRLLSRYSSSMTLLTYGLAEALANTPTSWGSDSYRQYLKENLAYAVQYLLKMQDTDGAVMGAIRRDPDIYPHKLDPKESKIPWVIDRYKGYEINAQSIAALTHAAKALESINSKLADQAIHAAKKSYRWLKQQKMGFKTPDLGNTLWALASLAAATGETEYLQDALLLTEELLNRQYLDFSLNSHEICGNFFHSAYHLTFDYQYKLIQSVGIYLGLAEMLNGVDPNHVLWPRLYYALNVFCQDYLIKMSELTPYGVVAEGLERNPDGTYRISYFTSPSAWLGPQGHGLNCDHFALGLIALKLKGAFPEIDLEKFAVDQLNGFLGQNYFGYSMMTGIGKRQGESLPEFLNLKPTPGGIMNGMIGKKGMIPYWGQHWISGEYWLPHLAFFFPLATHASNIDPQTDSLNLEKYLELDIQTEKAIHQNRSSQISFSVKNPFSKAVRTRLEWSVLAEDLQKYGHINLHLKPKEKKTFTESLIFASRSPIVLLLENRDNSQNRLKKYIHPVLEKISPNESIFGGRHLLAPKIIMASSTQKGEGPMEPRNACDRNLATRWSSDFSDPQWILFKFPKPVTISELRLWWETAYAKEYEIQISLDQQNWTSVFHEKKGDGELDKIEFEPISTQHLRILCLRRGTAYGYSIFEVEILG